MGSTRRQVVVGSFGVLLLTVAGVSCGDDESEAVGSVEEWCALVADIDAQFEVTDSSSDPFDVRQDEYAAINDQLETLADSIDVLPAAGRTSVAASIAWATEFTDTIVGAESEEEAGELLFGEDGVFAVDEPIEPEGAQWILDTCGVDIDGDESG